MVAADQQAGGKIEDTRIGERTDTVTFALGTSIDFVPRQTVPNVPNNDGAVIKTVCYPEGRVRGQGTRQVHNR